MSVGDLLVFYYFLPFLCSGFQSFTWAGLPLCLDLFPKQLQKGTIPTQRGRFSFSDFDSLSLMSAFPQYLVFKKTLISILEKQ